MAEPCSDEGLARYRPWFYTAAVYNFVWGSAIVLFPTLYFDIIGIDPPNYLPVWQVVGMFILVYAPAYWWVARFPARHRHILLIGLLGKLLGPVGFAWSAASDEIPWAFGWTIITNDLVWWPAFGMYMWKVVRECGGWRALLRGE